MAIVFACISVARAQSDGGTSDAGTPSAVSNARVFFWGNSAISFIGSSLSTPRSNVGVPMRAIANSAGLSGCEEGDYTPRLTPSMLNTNAYAAPNSLNFTMTLGASCNAPDWPRANFTVGVLTDNNINALTANSGWGNVNGAVSRYQAASRAEPNLSRWFLFSYQHDLDAATYTFSSWKSTQQPAFNRAFHQLQDDINNANSSINLRLIPWGTILLELVRSGGILDDFTQAQLFVDDAPHANESLFVVTGAVAYVAIYRRPVPTGYSPPSYVDRRIRSRWTSIRNFIWTRSNSTTLAPRVFGTQGVSTGDGGVNDAAAPDAADAGVPVDVGFAPDAVVDVGFAPDAVVDVGFAPDAVVDVGFEPDAEEPDVGFAPDAEEPDVGFAPDAEEPDVGFAPDALVVVDVGFPRDAAAPVDVGFARDAAAPIDLGFPRDAAAPVDVGFPRDAAAPVDVGFPEDAAAPVDLGSPRDAAAPMDSGFARDGAAPVDLGFSADAAPLDTGLSPDPGSSADSGVAGDASSGPVQPPTQDEVSRLTRATEDSPVAAGCVCAGESRATSSRSSLGLGLVFFAGLYFIRLRRRLF